MERRVVLPPHCPCRLVSLGTIGVVLLCISNWLWGVDELGAEGGNYVLEQFWIPAHVGGAVLWSSACDIFWWTKFFCHPASSNYSSLLTKTIQIHFVKNLFYFRWREKQSEKRTHLQKGLCCSFIKVCAEKKVRIMRAPFFAKVRSWSFIPGAINESKTKYWHSGIGTKTLQYPVRPPVTAGASTSCFWEEHRGIYRGFFFLLPHGNLCVTYFFLMPVNGDGHMSYSGKAWQGVQEFYKECAYSIIFSTLNKQSSLIVMYDIDSSIQLWGCSHRWASISPLPFTKPDIRCQWWLFLGFLEQFSPSQV